MTFLLFLLSVGVTRLELATSRPPDAYSNQLSYTPIVDLPFKLPEFPAVGSVGGFPA